MNNENIFFPPLTGIVDADIDYSLFTALSKDNILMVNEGDNSIITKDSIFFSSGANIKGNLINRGIFVIVGGEIILNGGKFRNEGSIFIVKENAKPLYYTEGEITEDINDNYVGTGIKMKRDAEDRDVVVSVSGPEESAVDWQRNYVVERGKKEDIPCYFSSDGGKTAKEKIEKGDELIWNSFFSNTSLNKNWKIIILF